MIKDQQFNITHLFRVYRAEAPQYRRPGLPPVDVDADDVVVIAAAAAVVVTVVVVVVAVVVVVVSPTERYR